MRRNRSMPDCVIIPTLAYRDVRGAVGWLCESFGFAERLAIGDHRAQLVFGNGAVVLTQMRSSASTTLPELLHSVMVRVSDADAHYRRAVQNGVRILQSPADYAYGERQYTAEDLGQHIWTFSQTIADIDAACWGGELLKKNGRRS
jgi:uncharacterized glyoxalase superfamily protein PhnB